MHVLIMEPGPELLADMVLRVNVKIERRRNLQKLNVPRVVGVVSHLGLRTSE